MDRIDYNEKMENLFSDHQTYQLVHKPPFAKIERELNHNLLDLKKKGKIDDPTYYKLRSTDAFHPPYEAQSNTIKQVSLFGPLCLALVLPYITPLNS